MAKIYANTMIERAGVVEVVTTAGETLLKYQDEMAPLRRVDYGDNREYIVQFGDTWQNISLRYLGDAALWWLIAEFNRVLDPFTFLTPGTRLIIPSATRVRLSSVEELS